MQINKHFEGSCELLSLNLILMLAICKLCTISVPTLCKNTAFIDKTAILLYKYHKISFCASVHKISSLCKCTQNQLTVQVYTKPVDCTSVHKTSLLYKCIHNQFTVQVYTKPIHCTSVHNTSCLYKCTLRNSPDNYRDSGIFFG